MPATREMPIVAEVAAGLGKVLAGNAGSESASAAEMAGTKAPAQMGAAEAADMRTAEAATDMRAAPEAASVAAAEAPTVAAPTSSATRERVSGQSCAERSSRRQDDHGLT
jgi:hypothetical protein